MSLAETDLMNIFGADGLLSDGKLLDSYAASDAFISGVRPRCVAYARSSEQVEKFMKLACETETPVIPVSSGGAVHKRGGTVPLREGTVILSLEKMKRVLEINAPFRMVTVEAGVTYGELNDALREHGLMVDMPLAPKAEQSVVASLLEGEPRLNPNIEWASYSPLCCVEVTWGDGVRMFTGEAGTCPPDYKNMREKSHIAMTMNSGPSAFDYNRVLFGAQGTTGAVTWAAIRCAAIPTVHKMFFIGAEQPDELISFLYDLEHVRFGECLLLLNAAAFAALAGGSAAESASLRASLPRWICAVSFANRPPFPSRRADAHEIGARRFAEARGLVMTDHLGGVSGESFKNKVFSPCAPGKYWKNAPRAASADLSFVTTMDQVSRFVEEFDALSVLSGIPAGNTGFSLQPMHQGVNCQCECSIFYDPQDPADSGAAKTLWTHAAQRFAELGAFYAHPIGIQCGIQYGKDPASTEMQRKMKDIFDPRGIMNPGKLTNYGKEEQE